MRISRLAERLVWSALLLASVYFVYSAVQGNHGLIKQVQLRDQLTILGAELHELQFEVDQMRNKAYRFSDDYLDLDLLDEQARRILGYVRTDELIVN